MLLGSVHRTDLYFLVCCWPKYSVRNYISTYAAGLGAPYRHISSYAACLGAPDPPIFLHMLLASEHRTYLYFIICCWSRFTVRTYISQNAAGLGAQYGPIFPHAAALGSPHGSIFRRMLLVSVHRTDLYLLMLLASVQRTGLYLLILLASVPRTALYFLICCWTPYPLRTYISSCAACLDVPYGPTFRHSAGLGAPYGHIFPNMLLPSVHRTDLYFLIYCLASVPSTDLHFVICC
jgi:hypothetical protein